MITTVRLTTTTLSEERATMIQINMVGGIHIRIDPIVPRGILYGRGAAGYLILNRTNAMNSKIIPKQYKKFSAAIVS